MTATAADPPDPSHPQDRALREASKMLLSQAIAIEEAVHRRNYESLPEQADNLARIQISLAELAVAANRDEAHIAYLLRIARLHESTGRESEGD